MTLRGQLVSGVLAVEMLTRGIAYLMYPTQIRNEIFAQLVGWGSPVLLVGGVLILLGSYLYPTRKLLPRPTAVLLAAVIGHVLGFVFCLNIAVGFVVWAAVATGGWSSAPAYMVLALGHALRIYDSGRRVTWTRRSSAES